VPVATFLLIAAGVTSVEKLAEKRPYIIIGAFVVGMLLTPPDVISQSLLAIPIWLLFELGLISSRIFLKSKDEEAIIMQNDDFELREEATSSSQAEDEDRELSDDEMEKLFDEAEQEEFENSRDNENENDLGEDIDKKP